MKHTSKHSTAADVPWRNADDLYKTIDSIQSGDAPWKCYRFSYTGPKPVVPPQWMEETYELNARDVVLVLEHQLDTSDFNGQSNYAPYQEFNPQGDRVYSNLMSGHWASREAVKKFHVLSIHTMVFISLPRFSGQDR